MYDLLAAAMLADHVSRRHHPAGRVEKERFEPESPWRRIFAWHRRNRRT